MNISSAKMLNIREFKFSFIFHLAVILLGSIVLFSNAVLAQENRAQEKNDAEMMDELMGILEEETNLVTKTRINSDYVPGMLTVLHGEELQKSGKLTVWDALSLVPGIKTLKNENGIPMIITRGIPNPFNSGNIKILVNSIPMSSEISGMNSALLLLPIDQVNRIEFIRGPGSSLYGNSAYMGLVNIITHQQKNKIQWLKNNDRLNRLSGQYFHSDEDGLYNFNAGISIQQDNNEIAPAMLNAESEQSSLMLQLDNIQTKLTGQFFKRDYSLQEKRFSNRQLNEQDFSLAISHQFSSFENINSEFLLSYNHNDFEENKTYRGSVTTAQLDNTFSLFQQQDFLLRLAFDHYTIDKATLCIKSPGRDPLSCPRNIRKDLYLSQSWNNVRLSFQQQYALTEQLKLTAGLGISSNEETEENTYAPRLAMVWQVADKHLLKAQYASGFRAPTYYELYDLRGEKYDLSSEQIQTYELGYIYKHHQSLARITLFYSKLKDLIHPAEILPGRLIQQKYLNQSQAKTHGIEFEWEQTIAKKLKLGFNLSYADAKGTRNDLKTFNRPAGVSDWLANISAQYRMNNNIILAAHYYHVSEQTGKGKGFDGYQKLDINLNWSDFFHKNLTLKLGINNLFDDDIYFFDTQPTASKEFQYEGRSAWLQLEYEFK